MQKIVILMLLLLMMMMMGRRIGMWGGDKNSNKGWAGWLYGLMNSVSESGVKGLRFGPCQDCSRHFSAPLLPIAGASYVPAQQLSAARRRDEHAD